MEEALSNPATEAPSQSGAAEAAFEALYRSSRDDLFAYVAGLLRDRSAAEDVTALAFERAYRKRSRFDPRRGSRRAWLFGIARNAALDEQEAEVALRRAALRQARAALDGRERELVSLKFFAGLSNAEIATVVGISPTNAGTRLHRTIEKLRRACNDAPSQDEERLDPEVERQLEAIEKALVGAEVEPDLAELATLTEDLREQRPEPREEWRRELDSDGSGRFANGCRVSS